MAKLIWVVCVLATLALSISGEAAGSPASPPQAPLDCSDVAMDMMDCLDYVSGGSNVSVPGAECCTAVAAVVNKSPLCLCAALDLATQMQIDVNMTRSLGLPKLCSVSVPDLHGCNSSSPAGSAPAPSTPSPEPSLPPKSSPVAPTPVSPPVSPATPVSPPVLPPIPMSPPSASGSPAEPPSAIAIEAPAPAPAASSAWELSSSLMVVLVGLVVGTVL